MVEKARSQVRLYVGSVDKRESGFPCSRVKRALRDEWCDSIKSAY
jgi:hypothetical protein